MEFTSLETNDETKPKISDKNPHPENCGELRESDGATDVTVTAPPSLETPSTAE
jgi:hypothetical protein